MVLINTLLVLLFFVLIFILMMKIPSHYMPGLFFLIKFLGSLFLDFERTRNYIFFQIIIFLFLMLIVFVKKGYFINKFSIKNVILSNYFIALIIYVAFFSLLGVINNHELFQIIIDAYKYIEIFIYFFLFRFTFTDNQKLKKGLSFLSIVMMVVGCVEIFTTERGGVGINLVISLFPMLIMMMMYKESKLPYFFMLFIVSLLIVVSSKTRTYIICFLFAIFMMFILSKGRHKNMLIITTLLTAVLSIILVVFLDSSIFIGAIERFMEVSKGFDVAGGYRIDEYIVALQKIKESPIIGESFGYLEYMYINKMGYVYWGDFIHNVYLEILLKTGITGGLYLVITTISMFRKILKYKKYFKYKDNDMYYIVIGGIISFITWLLIYILAPLTTYSSVYLGLIIASIAIENYLKAEKRN